MRRLRHYIALDGLRGIAALMVFIFHFYQGAYKYITIGQTGVTLFFVLSGFLITSILLYSKGEKNFLRNFFLKRLLRISPLYYFF